LTHAAGSTRYLLPRNPDPQRAHGCRRTAARHGGSHGLIDADVDTPGDQAFRFIGTAPFSGTPGEIRYYQVGDETFFELQTGTSVDIEGLIRIGSVQSAPEASWFVL
jgi:hypothetical protein